ncbi:acyl-CoA dehydrogenase [Marinobacter lipolyticus SM19]|uniref:Acyl-CoA dehydrogenase n=1 Tax=Marinobacter lipolyticus SM19 TaxID=1318628 RepID=R8AXM2_9GAMM|nr:acyl-CoA dehydrogenase family protein [Marinobacter lipolyticus]EON91071.1 acyl-CoA dehydrogenase [Marinobacter lipolyticus SM19]
MDELLPPNLIKLRHVAKDITDQVLAPEAQKVDENAQWPSHAFEALAQADLMGLHVPKRLGGHEQGLLALAAIIETLAQGCSSSALCYAMHCVGSAVIASKATRYQQDKYLVPIADNRHITTLALSEAGTGAHFYLPQTQLSRVDGHFDIHGTKQFVTNGGHADSYVISTQVSGQTSGGGDFNCLMVDHDTPGIRWLPDWRGFGMRGNSSRGMQLDQVQVPTNNLLGEEGDQIWYVFEVITPYFLTAMAATYTGLALASLNQTIDQISHRTYSHAGNGLADQDVIQYRVAQMKIAVDRCRALLYRAAYLVDQGHPEALTQIMMAKAESADTAVYVTNEAMSCCGGRAYQDNDAQARRLRDARAAHVMSPTTDLLKLWIGRQALGMPLL